MIVVGRLTHHDAKSPYYTFYGQLGLGYSGCVDATFVGFVTVAKLMYLCYAIYRYL